MKAVAAGVMMVMLAGVAQAETADQQLQQLFQREWAERLETDPHSPPYFRINGPVRNLDAWYDAFDVTPDDDLYLPPEERVRIW